MVVVGAKDHLYISLQSMFGESIRLSHPHTVLPNALVPSAAEAFQQGFLHSSFLPPVLGLFRFLVAFACRP